MTHKSLVELQLALQNFLLQSTQNSHDIKLANTHLPAQTRLHIYYDAYRLRLLDALRNDFPALEKYLGEDKFIALSSEFIAEHPSQHPSLRWFGEQLPNFLQRHIYGKEQRELGELAEFEWRQLMAFDAADTSLASIDELRTLPPEQWLRLTLELHPSLQLISCYSNAPALWNSLTNDKTTIAIEFTQEAQTWLLWRENLHVVYRPIDATEAWALTAFLNHKNVSDVCEGLCEWLAAEQVPTQVAQYLQHWIRGGLVTKAH